MPKQPTEGSRVNACWVSPVVAVAQYYGCDATVESVIAMQDDGADVEAAAGDVLWEQFRVGTKASFDRGEVTVRAPPHNSPNPLVCEPGDDWDPWDEIGDADVWMHGCDEDWKTVRPGMFVEEWGVQSVCGEWFGALQKTLESDNVAIMLAERLEEGEARTHAKASKKAAAAEAGEEAGSPAERHRPTHYLLLLGCQAQSGRRGRKSFRLFLKDPMEGNRLVEAGLEAGMDGKMVLTTTRADARGKGGVLDRFRPLQSYHICGKFPSSGPPEAGDLPEAGGTTPRLGSS